MECLNKVIKNKLKGYEDKSLAEQITVLTGHFNELINIHNALDKVFEENNLKHLWSKCPCCKSPILVNYGKCPYCDSDLTVKKDLKPEKIVETKIKEEPKEPLKTDKKSDTKLKSKKKKALKVIKVSKKPVVEDIEDNDSIIFPIASEVDKLRTPGLVKLIEKHDLEIDATKYKDAKALRIVVNNKIDEIIKFADVDEEGVLADEPTEMTAQSTLDVSESTNENDDDLDDLDDEVIEKSVRDKADPLDDDDLLDFEDDDI